MNAVEVATPLELVVSVSMAVPLAKEPLAPDAGAVNVTVAPLVGDPPVVTVATSGAANFAPTTALCPDPLVAVIDTAGGGVVFELLLQATSAAIMARAISKKTGWRNLIASLRSIQSLKPLRAGRTQHGALAPEPGIRVDF